jgi:hypothetical protein
VSKVTESLLNRAREILNNRTSRIWAAAAAVGVFLVFWQLHGGFHYFQLQSDMGVESDAFGHPIPNDSDRAQWAVLSENARERGTWRVKRLAEDNYPHGSDIYWSSSFVWMGRIASQIWAILSGGVESTHTVYWAGVFIAPVIGVVGGVLIFALGAFIFGIFPASLVTALVLFGPRAEMYFGIGAWDHHGLIMLLTGAFIMCSYKAVAQVRNGASSGRWFALSAASCALCYWLGVLSFAPVFAAVWAGVALCCVPLARGGISTFGKGGAGWIFIFTAAASGLYLVEFPDGTLHLRAEALNPSVIISVIGAGLCLEGLVRKLSGAKSNLLLISGATLASLFPIIIVGGGEAFYSPADPEFERFLQLIRECRPTSSGMFALFLPLWMAGILALSSSIRKSGRRCELLLLIVPAVALSLMGLLATRWYSTGALCVAVLLAGSVEGLGWRRLIRSPAVGLVALLIAYGMINLYAERSGRLPGDDFSSYSTGHQARNAAEAIKQDAEKMNLEPRGLVIVAQPGYSNYFSYYLKCKTVGKMSWEGFPSVRKWMTAISTKDSSVLREVLTNTKANYFVLSPADLAISTYTLYGRKALVGQPRYIGHDLLENKVPNWLEDITQTKTKSPIGNSGAGEESEESSGEDEAGTVEVTPESPALSRTKTAGIKIFRVKRDLLAGEGGAENPSSPFKKTD